MQTQHYTQRSALITSMMFAKIWVATLQAAGEKVKLRDVNLKVHKQWVREDIFFPPPNIFIFSLFIFSVIHDTQHYISFRYMPQLCNLCSNPSISLAPSWH